MILDTKLRWKAHFKKKGKILILNIVKCIGLYKLLVYKQRLKPARNLTTPDSQPFHLRNNVLGFSRSIHTPDIPCFQFDCCLIYFPLVMVPNFHRGNMFRSNIYAEIHFPVPPLTGLENCLFSQDLPCLTTLTKFSLQTNAVYWGVTPEAIRESCVSHEDHIPSYDV